MSTIHADKAASIPNRMYSLLETNQDVEQFLKTIHRYVQIGIYVRGYTDKQTHNFVREIAEVTEFYVTKDNKAESNTLYRKTAEGSVIRKNPSPYLLDYLEVQGVYLPKELQFLGEDIPISEVNKGMQADPSANGQAVKPTITQNVIPQANNQKAVNLQTNSVNQSDRLSSQNITSSANTLQQKINKPVVSSPAGVPQSHQVQGQLSHPNSSVNQNNMVNTKQVESGQPQGYIKPVSTQSASAGLNKGQINVSNN